MEKRRFVGVTYGEFQSLYCYGRTTISPDRTVTLGVMKRDGQPSKARKDRSSLLARLPQLVLDDQEGVVILELELHDQPASEISIGDIRKVMPTTERARRILEPRLLSLGVKLDKPWFEDDVLERWSTRNVDNALDGGGALCGLLFEDDVPVGEKLKDAVRAAIRQLDRQEGQRSDERLATWVPVAFRFTRHDPYDHGNVNYLIDAGKILSRLSWPPESDPIERCRDIVRGMIQRGSEGESLADIVNHSDVKDLAAQFDGNTSSFPAGLRSLVMFCRWKELFHTWHEEIDVAALAKETRDLVTGTVDFPSVSESLWLLGCFAGHERVAHLRYAAERYPWFSAPDLSISRIRSPAPTTAPGSGVETEVSDEAGSAAEKKIDQQDSGILPLELPATSGATTRLDGSGQKNQN